MLFNNDEKWATTFSSFMQSLVRKEGNTKQAALLYIAHRYDHCIMVYDRLSHELSPLSTPCQRASSSHHAKSFLGGNKFSFPFSKCTIGTNAHCSESAHLALVRGHSS